VERTIQVSYHFVKRTKNEVVIQGFDVDGNRTGSELSFQDGVAGLQAWIDLNGFTDIVPENILYYLESVQ
jgi:hypothetical protein